MNKMETHQKYVKVLKKYCYDMIWYAKVSRLRYGVKTYAKRKKIHYDKGKKILIYIYLYTYMG